MNKEQMNNKSWITIPENSDFPLENIPFGVIQPKGYKPQIATRIGDTAVSLSALCKAGFFDDLQMEDLSAFYEPVLNGLIALGKEKTKAIRRRLIDLFSQDTIALQNNKEAKAVALFPVNEVKMMLPVAIGDYTDFYSSIEHATNVGKMFRDPDHALLPNWRHIPVGYHGRSSSIVVSETSIHRPKGQTKSDEEKMPRFGPTKQLDFELEMGFITGKNSTLGDSIPVDRAEEFIFGMVLFNDLSARDIQKWEYVPLGPFLSKNFGSVMSPWIVTMEALEPFRVEGPVQEPEVLPYLRSKGKKNFDIHLEVALQPKNSVETLVSHSNFKYMYWNMSQQLAHQTVNGCNIRVGDLYASGTISGKSPDSYGSMLELTWRGTKPLKLADGSERKFVEDNDTLIMRGYCRKETLRIGFGECTTKIVPAK